MRDPLEAASRQKQVVRAPAMTPTRQTQPLAHKIQNVKNMDRSNKGIEVGQIEMPSSMGDTQNSVSLGLGSRVASSSISLSSCLNSLIR